MPTQWNILWSNLVSSMVVMNIPFGDITLATFKSVQKQFPVLGPLLFSAVY